MFGLGDNFLEGDGVGFGEGDGGGEKLLTKLIF